MPGVTAFGAYIPRLRLQRSAIAAANVWFDGSLKGHARGERAMCNWDEDPVTMAVAAARDCGPLGDIGAVTLASTTAPFADRQNAGIVAEAINLGANVRTMDVGGSQRAGTTALLSMLDTVETGPGRGLVVASEHRKSRVGSVLEMVGGDAAAALVISADDGIAKYLGGTTLAVDFIDHFRGEGESFDYEWEERWVRDEGFLKVVPAAVHRLLQSTGVAIEEVDHLIVSTAVRRAPQAVAKALGVSDDKLANTLIENCGQSGAAHPLLMFAHVLQQAAPGEKILLTGFGQGCDALLFETTAAITAFAPTRGASGALEAGVPEENYAKFQTFNGLVQRELGKRSEIDRSPALSAHNRNRRMVNGFIGGKCSDCGTVQFPKSHYCVNPNCGKPGTQEDHPMSNLGGAVMTYTADNLTFDLNPPAYSGLVEFDAGGRAVVDYTEVDPSNFDVGTKVRMQFRIKHLDARRGYRTYFWKAAPA
jgi:3-hydroxy-3-methylglutaryl CoA synthase